MKRREFVPGVFAVAGALLLAGCTSYAANTITLRPGGGTADIQVVNHGLHEDLEIKEGQVAYEQDVLVGWVRIQNHEDEKMAFEYRWRWWDSGDKQITIGGGGEAWLKAFVNPLETVEIDGRSTTPGAVRGECEVRYAME
jgi:uncharacterized protein YcfL